MIHFLIDFISHPYILVVGGCVFCLAVLIISEFKNKKVI